MRKTIKNNLKLMIAFAIASVGLFIGSTENTLCELSGYGTYEWGLTQGFDAAYYAEANPDVVAALGTDPVALWNHYITYGKSEGRKMYEGETAADNANEIIIETTTEISAAAPDDTLWEAKKAGFDFTYYGETYPDVKAAFGDAETAYWAHYIAAGYAEQRSCFEGDPGNTIQIIDSRHIRINQSAKVKASMSKDSGYVYYKLIRPEFNNEGNKWSIYMNQLVNEHRANNGLTPATLSDELCRLAQIRAKELNESYSHTRPDGRRGLSVLEDAGMVISAGGENICWTRAYMTDQELVEHIFRSLQQSTAHNGIMLGSKNTYAGYGFFDGDDGKLYCVQLFMNEPSYIENNSSYDKGESSDDDYPGKLHWTKDEDGNLSYYMNLY